MNKIYFKYKKNKALELGRKTNKPKESKYDFFIVIPAYNERDYIFKTLDSIEKQHFKSKLLVVVVVNNSDQASAVIVNNNKQTYIKLSQQTYTYELIIIDCFSKIFAINSKVSGVGVARKIGLDYCLKFSHLSSLLCCLDADTLASTNYLTRIHEFFKKSKFQAAVVGFKHQISTNIKINNAIQKYEIFLQYNAKHIRQSGSPYGYVSMGSTIVCTAEAYIAVGGMSTKKATEDFYFLQALAKYTTINIIPDILVYPSSRAEQRVYLGTGYRMQNIKSNILFDDIKISQVAINNLKLLYKTINKDIDLPIELIEKKLCKKNLKLWVFLNKHGFSTMIKKVKNNAKTKNQLINQFNKWFDNLKIHQLCKEFI